MCIGLPMQVLSLAPGHAQCQGRGQQRRVKTALVGALQVGDWVLVFMDSAQEHISPQRAAEVNATLDLMEAVLQGQRLDADRGVGFALPSAMGQDQLAALCGSPAQATLAASPSLTLLETP